VLVAGGVRWWLAPGVDPGDARALAERAIAALASERPWKRGRRKALYRLTRDGDVQAWLLKVSEPGALAPLRRLGAEPRAPLAGDRGAARGGGRRDAAADRRGRAAPRRAARAQLRAPALAPRRDRPRALPRRRDADPRPKRRAAAVALGALARALHDAGVDQDDLAPNNFLWRSGAGATLLAVDFERARARDRVPPAARWRALAKLDRYCAGESAASRMRVLRAYCGDDRIASRDAARAIEAAAGRPPRGRRAPLDTRRDALEAPLRAARRRGRSAAGRGAARIARRFSVRCAGSRPATGSWRHFPRGIGAPPRAPSASRSRSRSAISRRGLTRASSTTAWRASRSRARREPAGSTHGPRARHSSSRSIACSRSARSRRTWRRLRSRSRRHTIAFGCSLRRRPGVPAWLGPGRRAEARRVADRLARSLD
jgi:hypothetical protein